MEISEGVYALPQTLEIGDQMEKIYPVAVEDQDGLLMIDAGLPNNIDKVRKNLNQHGFKLEDINKLVLTHQDFDHCGCAAKLVEETNPTVLAHKEDAPAIDGREDPLKGSERYPSVEVDVELTGGETIRTQEHKLKVIHTPGHTPGHISLLLDNLLISGDVLNVEEEGFKGPRERFTPDMNQAVQSLNKLSFESYTKVHCFHGGTVDKTEEDVKHIFEELNQDYKGFQKASVEGPDRFLRSELRNTEVGLSIFQISKGETHGAQENPQKGHRHSEQTEIYYFQQGSGSFSIGQEKIQYTEGDAFLVKPYKLRRINAEEQTQVIVAGAPVGDEAEEGSL